MSDGFNTLNTVNSMYTGEDGSNQFLYESDPLVKGILCNKIKDQSKGQCRLQPFPLLSCSFLVLSSHDVITTMTHSGATTVRRSPCCLFTNVQAPNPAEDKHMCFECQLLELNAFNSTEQTNVENALTNLWNPVVNQMVKHWEHNAAHNKSRQP